MDDKLMGEKRTKLFAPLLWAVSLLAVAAFPPRVMGQGVDLHIQQQVDQYVYRPSGEDLIIKRKPVAAKKHKATRSAPEVVVRRRSQEP
jgi:hypothetical protein